MSTTIVLVSLMCMCSIFAICFGMIIFRKKICAKVPKFPILCKTGSGGGGGSSNSPPANNTAPAPQNANVSYMGDAVKPGPSEKLVASGKLQGKMIMTFFDFDTTTPANANSSSSGASLIPYVSCAVPFRFLKSKGGGPFEIGDWIKLKFLEGRVMPNKKKHTGWVKITTFCGDSNIDSYCIKTVDGQSSPTTNAYGSVDLYIGEWKSSGQKCNGDSTAQGPAGNGLQLTEVYAGPPPSGQAIESYGGKAIGSGQCNNVVQACMNKTNLSEEVCRREIKNLKTERGQPLADGSMTKNSPTLYNNCYHYLSMHTDQAKGWCNAKFNAPGGPAANGGL